jgi:hypothetical protein
MKQTDRIVFKALPAGRRLVTATPTPKIARARWRLVLDARPGEWARIKKLDGEKNVGGYRSHYGNDYQFAVRTINGVAYMFARRSVGP